LVLQKSTSQNQRFSLNHGDGLAPWQAYQREKGRFAVKGGGIGVKDVRELGNVVDRERAKIGVFISLEPHRQPMVKEAAGAGLYEGPTGKVPKIQLFTIEELLGGRRPRIPLVERAFKVTGLEETAEQEELDL